MTPFLHLVLYLSVPEHFNLFLDPSLADADLYIHYFQQDQPRTKEREETGGAGARQQIPHVPAVSHETRWLLPL